MSNNKKTQGDIDKLIKKIQEGIEEYEALYDKFAEAPSAALKERFEGDLKKEIKKLQRLREQVKALIQSPEVKDKKALEGARRRVEEKMEAFKVVERETKTKTFSKEGLANLTNNASETPQQRTESWIKNAISDLKEQIETAEFEVAAEGTGKRGKKASKGDDPREQRLLRLKFNTLKLEQLLRLVVNEDLEAEEVDEIEEDVQRYIDDNQEDDFEEDEQLYDRFDLPDIPIATRKGDDEEEDEEQRAKAAPKAVSTPAAAPAAKPAAPKSAVVAAAAAKANDTPPSSASKTPASPAAVQKAPVAPAQVKQPAATPAAAQATTPATPATPYGKKTVAAVVAAGVAAPAPVAAKTPLSNPPVAPMATGSSATKPTSFAAAAAAANVVSSGAAKASSHNPVSSSGPSSQSPMFPSAMPHTSSGMHMAQSSGLMDDGALGDDGLDDLDDANDDTFGDDAMPSSNGASLADMAMTTNMMQHDWDRTRQQGNFQQQRSGGVQQHSSATANITAPRAVEASPPSASPTNAAPPTAPLAAGAPNSTTNVVWSALLKAQQPTEEKVAMHRMLDMSLQNLNHVHDVERIRPFVPPNPYQTRPHHPQTVHPGFSSPEMFRRFDPDTLFFIFYYQQQTYQQYLAAKELKRQSFRYHKKFKTWFQRHDKPKESTEEYESGAYLYFDYENGWCQRIKNDFVFKYNYLEDELV